MPSKEIVFTVHLPIRSVWSFMSDRKEVGCLFPGCKGVEIINDLDSVWTVRMSLGPFSRTLQMKTRTTEIQELERLSWIAHGDNISASGTVSLERLSDDETEVTYRIEGHVNGRFHMLQDIVIAEQLGELTRKFMKAVKERLEWTAESEG